LVEERTSNEIFEATKLFVQKEKGRKVVLSAGCEITVNTLPENLMAMRKASIF
jgi:uroporphyrinogen-III decarboxylase